MSHEVPIWQKANLTLEEAAAYYNIGINKLRQITDRKECEKYVLWVGTVSYTHLSTHFPTCPPGGTRSESD